MWADKENFAARPESHELLGLPTERENLFSDNKGKYKKKIEKRQTKFFKQISFIKPFLDEDEKIFLVTTGCSPLSGLEQILTGWISLIECHWIKTYNLSLIQEIAKCIHRPHC